MLFAPPPGTRRASFIRRLSGSALLLLSISFSAGAGWELLPRQAPVGALLVTGGADETVWVAVGPTLVEMDAVSGENRRVHSVADGLLGESIDGLVEDGRGTLWVAYGPDGGWENHLLSPDL